MKTIRPTFVLIGLFFAGMLVLWWLEDSGTLTEAQRRGRQSRVLPNLADVQDADISRVDIVRGGEILVFERRGKDGWQMTKPLNVAADSTIVETLVGNLKSLRKSPDSGTITGAPETYGLAPPAAVVRLWRDLVSTDSSEARLLAALEIGKTVRDQSFVRPLDSPGIEVVDKKLLGAASLPVTEWRQMNLIPVPSFHVAALAIRRNDMKVKAERGRGGRWSLTEPVRAPANGAKIESAIAAFAAIRVVGGPQGFVADDVTDLAPFGLDKPEASIELSLTSQPDSPLVLHVGKKVPEHADRVYVRRGDQDDVVTVSDRFLSEVPRDSIAFRSQHVTDIDAGAVSEISIDAFTTTFRLERQGRTWELKSPRAEKADMYSVVELLKRLDGLQTSEFLDPARVVRSGLEQPLMTLRLWQSEATGSGGRNNGGQGSVPIARPPALSLRIGRHDVLKKAVYAQIEGDNLVLALPDTLLEVLPRNRLAYRDHGVLALNPGSVSRLELIRHGSVTVLEPDRSPGTANQWRMTVPARAQADIRAITQLMALLSDLRAEDFAAETVGDGKPFGLDQPLVTAAWSSEASPSEGGKQAPGAPQPASSPGSGGRLRIGKAVPGKLGMYYAAVDTQPYVFTLGLQAVQTLLAEFHDLRVLSFPADSIRRLVLKVPDRTLAFSFSPQPTPGPANWRPEPGTDAGGIDLSRFNDLVKHLAELRATRFSQYDGPIPEATGLARPRLTIELDSGSGKPAHSLRIGHADGGFVFAATGTSPTGPVFQLPGAAWNALIPPAREIPADPFAH